ncbi:hypothetical protein L2E82_30643 [Cichorium intybus]|uniref:Uncharacterized protein n=1 Tax=Cichorium intybus TaxID=13427 RepID=A0ACB9D0Y8_CICIN|nr:hypothetical protein L2E82_30643 [Cichorium intybus]
MGDPLGSPRVAPPFLPADGVIFARVVEAYGFFFDLECAPRHVRRIRRLLGRVRSDRWGPGGRERHGRGWGDPRLCAPRHVRRIRRLWGRVRSDRWGPGGRERHGRGWGDPRLVRHKGNKHGKYFGCDHTSTNAPDSIRTPQLSCAPRHVRRIQRLWGRVRSDQWGRGGRERHGRGWGDPRLVRHKGNKHGKYFGCDHTSTNAPDPIRTPQLSCAPRHVRRIRRLWGRVRSDQWGRGGRERHGRGWGDPRLVRHKGNKHGKYFGCDHTSTNAPDPIRTPQLSVLGRE